MILEVKEACNPDQQRLIDFIYETGCRGKTPRFVPKPDWLEIGEGKLFKHNAYPRYLKEKVKSLGQPKWNWHGLRKRRASICSILE